MNRRTFTKSLLAALVLGFAAPIAAQAQVEEEVFGRQLMTQQEIQEHQRNMRTLQGGEREAYRQSHHERMLERARERGVELQESRGNGAGRPEGAGRDRGYGPRDGGGRPEGAGPDRGYGSGQGGGGRGPGGMGGQGR
jgi:hypothetical protein